MHSRTFSTLFLSSILFFRKGIEKTLPVECKYESCIWEFFFTAHAETVFPATLAKARPDITA